MAYAKNGQSQRLAARVFHGDSPKNPFNVKTQSNLNQRPLMKHDWKIVEKKNRLACHGLFSSQKSAAKHLSDVIPDYVRRGYFMDKTLTAQDFEVVGPEIKPQ